MTPEQSFHAAMVGIYETAKADCRYTATRFIQMVAAEGGLEAAQRLIHSKEPSDGFTTLWEHRRLDLSVEALVLRSEFESLFSEEERIIARRRLRDYGYDA